MAHDKDRTAPNSPNRHDIPHEELKRLRVVFDHVGDAIFIVDDTGRIIDFNRTSLDRYGYSRDELHEMSVQDIDTPEHARFVPERIALVKRRRIHLFETLHRTKDNRIIPTEVNAQYVHLDGKDFHISICRDITERKATEEALAQSEERFRSAFDYAPVGMALVSVDGKLLQVNKALCEILGYAREKLLEKTLSAITHPDDRAHEMILKSQLLNGTKRYFRMEKRYLHADGHVVFGQLSVSLLKDGHGKPLYYIGQLEDITARTKMEEELRQSQKMEAIGKLAGGIAHDFNNLLTAITGYTDLLLSRFAETDPGRREIEEIKKAGLQAAGLTRQLLAFSRKQIFQPKPINMNQVVGNMDTMLRRLIGEDIVLKTLLSEGLWNVQADPGQMEMVLLNLAVNSRDAMPRGGNLTIETKNVHLDATSAQMHNAFKPGPYVMITMSDTGCGMDETTKNRIFEPFFTTKEPGKGTGLGLSTVYGIIKQSRGYIWAHSEPGMGTTFQIYLPKLIETVEHTEFPVKGETPDRRGEETVLLAEDQVMVRELVTEILRKSGYTVLATAHGEEALRVAEEFGGSIHILLTDVVMPNMSGPDLAKRILDIRPEVKVLYMSGYTEDAIIHHDVLDEGVEFIQKPFKKDALLRKIREVLDKPQVVRTSPPF